MCLMAKSLRDRLIYDLTDVRKELRETVAPMDGGELDEVPGEGMRSARAVLQEVGAMEAVCMSVLLTGQEGDWQAASERITGDSGDALLAALDDLRRETLDYVARADESKLQTPAPLPESWFGYFDSADIAPEDMIRWIARHEYYHLGQLVIYRWLKGHSPNRED